MKFVLSKTLTFRKLLLLWLNQPLVLALFMISFIFSKTINSKNLSSKVSIRGTLKSGRSWKIGEEFFTTVHLWPIFKSLTLEVWLLTLQNWRNLIKFWRKRRKTETKCSSSAKWQKCSTFSRILWTWENIHFSVLMELPILLTEGTWSMISKNHLQRCLSSFFPPEQVAILLFRWSRSHSDCSQYCYLLWQRLEPYDGCSGNR